MSAQQQGLAPALPRARLRPWTAADADVQAVLRAFAGPGMAGQSHGPIATEAQARGWIAPLVPDPLGLQPRTVAFAIELDGEAVGNVMVSAIERRHLTCWMSYWVAPGARGAGLAGAAATALAGHCFTVLGLERLELGIG
ncbi:GNAT family N-acetyltransferase [Arthrobacter sp.]|uniref:GNAT family N-acetyltransferase n=1 Tax=Arthrobacter sp. TaxID=1667 RepID=UPI003A9560DE